MRTEVTRKKKTLTIKRHPVIAPPEEASVKLEMPVSTTSPDATPVAPVASAAPVKSPGSPYMISAIFALVAVLLFVILILVQVLELAEYRKPPTVWPSFALRVPSPSMPQAENVPTSPSE